MTEIEKLNAVIASLEESVARSDAYQRSLTKVLSRMHNAPTIDREALATIDADVVLADGYDDCVIGLTDSWSGSERPLRVVYSVDRIIAKLVLDGMSFDDAEEFFEFNVAGAYVGPRTPVFVRSVEP